jgi:hypothetical protein
MRRDWILGTLAMSTLAVLVGIDLIVAVLGYKGLVASSALLRSLRSPGVRR